MAQATYAVLAKNPVQAVKMLNEAFSFPFTLVGTRRENENIILCDVIIPDLDPELTIICDDYKTLLAVLSEVPVWTITSCTTSDDERFRFTLDVPDEDGLLKKRLLDAEDYRGLQFIWWINPA